MEITVYSAKDLHYLLVPSFFLPSNECDRRHGPLVLCGHVMVADDGRSILWRRVIEEIRRHHYCVVTASIARRLLGDHHQSLQPPRPVTGTAEERAPGFASDRRTSGEAASA